MLSCVERQEREFYWSWSKSGEMELGVRFGHVKIEMPVQTSTQSSGARTLESSTQVTDRAKGAGEMNQKSHEYRWGVYKREGLEPTMRSRSQGGGKKPGRAQGPEISKERNVPEGSGYSVNFYS